MREVQSEFERRMCLSDLGAGVSQYALAADERERAAIAGRLNLISLEVFDVSVQIRSISRGKSADIRGTLNATVSQHCISTLQPVVRTYAEEFAIRFVGAQTASKHASEGAQDLTLELEDLDIEVLDGEEFDIGEAAVQYLALALDPYPRADGVTDWPSPGLDDAQEAPGRQNPFAVLKKLRDKT